MFKRLASPGIMDLDAVVIYPIVRNTVVRPLLCLPANGGIKRIEDLAFNAHLKQYTDAQGQTWALPYRGDFMRFINEKYDHYRTSAAKFHDAILASNFNPSTAGELLPPFKYQEFVLEYLRYGTPYRALLLEHGLGSGKTRTAIMVAESFRAVGIHTLILTPAFLATNFKAEIKKWVKLSDDEINAYYHFVSYNAGGRVGGQGSVLEQLAKLGIGFPDNDPRWENFPYLQARYRGLKPPQNWFIIIEEMHGLNRSFSNTQGKIRRELYQLLLEARDCKILGLSGTPMIEPFELGTMYNILRGPICAGATKPINYAFPETAKEFSQKFIGTDAQGEEVLKNQDVFQKRICGLHSYFKGVSTDISGKIYPKAIYHEVLLDMSDYQQALYQKFAQPVRKRRKKNAEVDPDESLTGPMASNFLALERKLCNFAFPKEFQQEPIETAAGKQDTRAKLTRLAGMPHVFSLDPQTGIQQYSCKMYEIFRNLSDPAQGCAHIAPGLEATRLRKLHAMNRSVPPAHAHALTVTSDFIGDQDATNEDEFSDEDDTDASAPTVRIGGPIPEGLADVYLTDAELDQKYHGNWTVKGGPVMIYSFFSVLEGAGIFSKLLEAQGYEPFRPHVDLDPVILPRKLRYAFIRGGMTGKQKERLLRVFNHSANAHGQLIKVVFVTLAAVEGISLFHLRQIHIMEPYWDRNIIRQVTGRGFRLKSHFNLPEEECTINVFEYTARCQGMDTADVLIRDIAERKDRFQEDFKQLRMSAAVDCGINLNHHTGVHCFEFNTQADGYTYHSDVDSDMAVRVHRVPVKVERIQTKNHTLVWNPEQFINIRHFHPERKVYERVTSVHRVFDEQNMTKPILYVKTVTGTNVFYRPRVVLDGVTHTIEEC